MGYLYDLVIHIMEPIYHMKKSNFDLHIRGIYLKEINRLKGT